MILSETNLYRGTFLNFAYVLGNLAGDSLQTRDLLMNHAVFDVFISKMPLNIVKENFSEFSWVIRLFLRGNDDRNYPSIEITKKLVKIVAEIFKSSYDPGVIFESGWSLCFFLNCNIDKQERIDWIISLDILHHLGKCLFELNFTLKPLLPLLFILEKLAEGSEHQVVSVFNNDSDIEVKSVLNREYSGMLSKAVWRLV